MPKRAEWEILLKQNLFEFQLTAAVFAPARLIGTTLHRIFFALGEGCQQIGRYAEAYQIVLDGLGSTLTESEVVFPGAALIAVPLDSNTLGLELFDALCVFLQDVGRIGSNSGLVEVEVDALQRAGRWLGNLYNRLGHAFIILAQRLLRILAVRVDGAFMIGYATIVLAFLSSGTGELSAAFRGTLVVAAFLSSLAHGVVLATTGNVLASAGFTLLAGVSAIAFTGAALDTHAIDTIGQLVGFRTGPSRAMFVFFALGIGRRPAGYQCQ